ncbi:hypothetical protein, partial [Enterobacter sp. 56-7]|uniref:transposase n=1 Tax=Enterobacter sp. 56-7 TaxID=1895906 RepID=UPI00257CDEA5
VAGRAFGTEDGLPSDKWLAAFVARAKERHGLVIDFNKAEIKAEYAVEQNTPEVHASFYKLLAAAYGSGNYTSAQVWSADESGSKRRTHTKQKVASVRGAGEQRRAGSTKVTQKTGFSGHVTVMAAGNAAGHSAAFMAIVSGKTVDAQMVADFPEDTLLRVSDSGSMTSELMGEWFDHFAIAAKQQHAGPHLLIIDNVKMHWSKEVIERAWANQIEILFLPPHTTAKLQVWLAVRPAMLSRLVRSWT